MSWQQWEVADPLARTWILLFATVPTIPYCLPYSALVISAICLGHEFMITGLGKGALIFSQDIREDADRYARERPARSARICYIDRWKVKYGWQNSMCKGTGAGAQKTYLDDDKQTRMGGEFDIWGRGLRERNGEAGKHHLLSSLAPQNKDIRFCPVKTGFEDW